MRLSVHAIATVCAPLLVAAALSSCATMKAEQPSAFTSAPLFGMIYDHSNRPVSGVAVTVDGKQAAKSDVNGRFVIPRLSCGAHSIVVTKAGFEQLTTNLDFADQTQVLYLQMLSQSELLELAQNQLTQHNWARAQTLLERAGKVDGRNPVYHYTLAILDYQTKKIQQAVSELTGLLSSGVTAPSVYLLLADIYQYSLDKPQQAIVDLKKYLDQKGDDAVAERLAQLQKSLSSSPPATKTKD